MFLALKCLKISSNRVNSNQKAESKVGMMFLEIEKEQTMCASCFQK